MTISEMRQLRTRSDKNWRAMAKIGNRLKISKLFTILLTTESKMVDFSKLLKEIFFSKCFQNKYKKFIYFFGLSRFTDLRIEGD
jgi:hypothetical protein